MSATSNYEKTVQYIRNIIGDEYSPNRVGEHVLRNVPVEWNEQLDDVVQWVYKSAEYILGMEWELKEMKLEHKDRLWKCHNILCGHVFEADENRCPICYG